MSLYIFDREGCSTSLKAGGEKRAVCSENVRQRQQEDFFWRDDYLMFFLKNDSKPCVFASFWEQMFSYLLLTNASKRKQPVYNTVSFYYMFVYLFVWCVCVCTSHAH